MNAVRGGVVDISRAAETQLFAQLQRCRLLRRASSRRRASIVKPSTCSVRISPPRRSDGFEQHERDVALGELVGRRETGNAAANDDDHVGCGSED